jgi:hypothetical protein
VQIAGISKSIFAILRYALERATMLTGRRQASGATDAGFYSHYDTIIFSDLHLIIIYSDNTPRVD